MKVIDRIKVAAIKIWHLQALKYLAVCVISVLFVGFIDENSLWSHLKNQHRIGELEDEIAEYNAAFERDQAQIRELNSNPKAMEKIARERYFMKADDEDIFVLSDDDRTPKPIVGHEAAE